MSSFDPLAAFDNLSKGTKKASGAFDPTEAFDQLTAPKKPRTKLTPETESLIGVDRLTSAERDIEYERTLTPEKKAEKRNLEKISSKKIDKAFEETQAQQIASQPKYQSFGKALLAGIDDAQKLVFAGTEAVGEVLGGRSDTYTDERGFTDMLAAAGKEGRESNTAEADEYGPRGKFADINNVGDAFAWATQTAGNMIPVMVPAMAGGAAGAAAAPALGVTATVGSAVGAFVPSLVISTGEVQASAKEKDPTKEANGWTFVGGTAIAALDSVLPGRIGGKLVEKFGREGAEEIALRALLRPAGAKMSAEIAKGALKEGVKSAAIEGLTESVQEAIGEVTASLASESKIDWKGLPSQMLEAGAGGALMGAGTGGPSGGITAAKDVVDANALNAGYQDGVNQEAAGLTLPATSIDPNEFASFVEARNTQVSPDPKVDVPLTDDDRKSPLPNDLLQTGKNVIADATGVQRPKAPPKVAAPFDRMVQIVLGLEGGGTLANPKTSPKGAQGPMQVMPGTNTDPGFGVRPARDNSEAERARVGRDYLAAMLRRYGGDPAKALAAYNAGPGRLDDAMKAHGADWLDNMPGETRAYVMKGLGKLGGQAFDPSTGEVASLEVPEQAEIERESAEDYAKRILGDDVFDTPANVADPLASLEPEDLAVENLQARVDALEQAPVGNEIEQQGGDLRGEQIDDEFVAFAEDSGSLGLPRAEMPQIKAENRGALVNFLKARGIASEDQTVSAASLRPTQREFSPAKVQKAKEFTGGNRAVLASSDGYIVDGHHQWLAARDNGENIRILKLDAPIADLIPLAREFPSSEVPQEPTTAIPDTQDMITGPRPSLQGTGQKPKRRGGGYGDFLTYLADIGGVRDDEGHSLSKMRGMQQPIAGAGSLIRSQGRSIDEIGEKAYEDGWFPQRPTTAQVLDLIESAQFSKVYHPFEQVERDAEDAQADQDITIERLQDSAASIGVELNEDELMHAVGLVGKGVSIDGAMIQAVEWEAARVGSDAFARNKDSDYDVAPFEEVTAPFDESAENEQAGKIDESLPESSERPQVAEGVARPSEAQPEKPSGDNQPEITDSASGKGVVVRGASPEAGLTDGGIVQNGVAGYGSKNKVFTKDSAAKARETLRKAANRLNSAGFDPEVAQAGLTLMGFHIEAGARSFIDASKAVAQDLGLTPADLRNSLRSWYLSARMWMEDNGQDVRGMDDADAVKVDMARIDTWGTEKDSETRAGAPFDGGNRDATATRPQQSSDETGQLLAAFTSAFMDGRAFASITEARALAAETLGRKVEAGTADAKMLDEVIEAAVIQAARAIAIENRDDAYQAYQRLVGLYARQPKLTVRTSTSIEQQAYSTPAPLSYLASRLAGIGQTSTVYEPSAGNGALLIEAKPMYVTANELNPQRAAMLRRLYSGATITEGDAMADNLAPKQFDVVIGNPPFGPVKDGAGNNVEFEVAGFTTKEIDHAIALKALEKMTDDGSAVLIVGGINKLITDPKARADAYNGKAKRDFYFRLYSQYNVVDHFTADGSLYERQGAGWPVDLIVIKGRGKSALPLPAVRAPRQYDSWQDLAEVLSNERPQEATRPVRATDGEFVAERTGPATVDVRDIGSSGSGGPVGRIGSDTTQQPEPVRDGPVDRQPDSPSVGGIGNGVVEPVSDQRQRRVDREDQTGLTENARQVIYQPGSDATAMGTLVPVNMQTAVDTALDVLRSRVGNIDDYVATQLGYTRDTLYKAFGAEQIDALALAIHNIEDKGAGFIIGDQTGIGKGRVVAGVIRYAMRQGRPPIFVTEKANLFADIYRDLVDIGVPDMLGRDLNIVMTNSGESVPLGEGLGELKSKGSKAHTALLQKLAAEGLQSEGVDVLFTTYSQMQTVKGQETDRQRVLDSLAQGGVLLLDESHNAGGTTGGFKKAGAPLNRADFVRKLVGKAHGVFYSSATYAKRPDVMSLYAATDMRLAVKKIEDLGDAIGKGGVPMQQVVAAMLARAGQYVRRERSFDGIAYNTPIVEVNRDQYAATAGILSSIQSFSEDYVGAATEKMDEELRAAGEALGFDNAVGKAGASSTNFTAIMHNVIDQMLLAFSADATADRAIEAIENGEKPVITVANTLESMLDQYAEVAGISVGQEFEITFADVFRRYLERSRWITIKKPQGSTDAKGKEIKSERKRLTDSQLGPAGVAAFNETMQMIGEAGLESLPGSPIDYILSRIQDAGYKVGEITGRGTGINYRNGKAYLKVRPDAERSIKGRLKTINGFNDGSIDVVLLNRSGSTGLSLHASEKFKDQRKRRMIIAQAEGNIDTHMQMLGRVHRTGQVVLPEYDQIVIGVPAAKRPAANLARKMASLNASTTASRDSALTSKESVDFMNVYGDQVVAAIMQEEPDIHRMLAEPLAEEDEGYMIDGAARKVTGRIPLLPVEMQEELYDRIESEYKALLEQKEAAGENALEAKTYDLQARVLSSQQVVDPRDASSPFGEAVFVDKVSVKRLGKPYTSEKVIERIAEANDVDVPAGEPAAALKALFDKIAPTFAEETAAALKAGQEWAADDIAMTKDDAAKEKRREKNGDTLRDFRALRNLLVPGRTIRILTENGNFYGTVSAGFKTGKAKNPLALGSWKVTIDVVDAARSLTFPFSQLSTTTMENGKVKVEAADSIGLFSIIDAYSNMQTDSREERSIVTGNMLAGFDYVNGRGAIINYTTEDGDVRQGIMLNKDFDLAKHMARQPISFTTADMVLAWLETLREPLVGTGKTGSVSVFSNQYRNEFTVVAAKSKKVGGEFFLNGDLTRALGRDFVSRSNGMVAEVSLSKAKGVIETLLSMGVDFEVEGSASDAVKERAREIVNRFQPKPKMSIGEPGLFDAPAQPEKTMTDRQRAELEARQKQGMARRGGQVGLGDQEGGLFGSERDQGTLFSRPTNRIGNPEVFGRKVVSQNGFSAPRNLQAELNKLGIGDRVVLKVASKLLDNKYIRGTYWKRTISIAVSSNPNPFETLNHEVIHALKDLGLFKPDEWRALEKAARADKAMMSSIRFRYGREGLTESELVEEGVADMFGAWRAGTVAQRGFIRDAFERIVALFRALRRAITGANAQDEAARIVREQALNVMKAIDSGEIGSRRSPFEGLRQNTSPRAMVAYHGTPHDFDIFSTDAIGTGEGAQAYGWGLYFTDTKGVAEHYRNNLSSDITVDGKRYSANGKYDLGQTNAEERAVIFATTAIKVGEDFGMKANWLRGRAREAEMNPSDISYFQKESGWDDFKTLREAADILESWDGKDVKLAGRLFEVDIPEESEYLLWDKPMSAQPKVKEAVGAWIDSQREVGINGDETITKTIEALEKLIKEDAAGADIVMAWQRRMSARSVSLAMKDNGIKGTKYLDRNSRGREVGTPTFNYVIFDASSVEVREKYSISGKLLGNGLVDGILDRLDVWRANLQDRMLPLLRAQQRVEAQSGLELDEAANPYLAEELMSGKVGARLERLTDEMVDPLFEQMSAEGIDAEELETYLYARHAPERNERISRINDEFAEGTGSGMSDAEAAGILTMAEAEGKLPALERLAAKVDAILRFAVETRVEAGLLSEEEAETWAETYRFYVPLRGFAEIEPESGQAERPRAGSGINVRGPESKRAFGRKSKAADILAYSIMQAEEAIVRAGRNEVAQAFYQMVKANPDEEFWTVKTVRRTPVWNEKSGTVSYRVTDRIDPQDEPYTVSLKIDGQERRVTLNRENPQAVRLATAMRNLSGNDLGSVMRFLSGVNRYLSLVNTGLNPEFVITNAFRDMQTAGINLAQFDKKGLESGTIKDYRKALAASMRGSYKDAAAYKKIFGEGDQEWAKWYREFLENGGRVYFNRVDDLNEIRERIATQMSAKAGALGVARSTFTNILSFIENANMGVENAIRLSAYKNARERGMSPAQAASLAKNLTVNFNRRGAWGTAMNSLYLFYNASIQGSARLLQAAFAKGKGGNRVRMILGAAVAIGYGLDMLNMMLSDDDDDGESYYDKISSFDKSRNLIVMLPGEKGKHIKIPLPYGYNAFFALGRSASEISQGKDWKASAAGFLETVVDAFNPVGGTNNLMNLIAPTIADPIVDLTRNRDFADRPIMPEQSPYAPEIPDSQKYWDSINPHWRTVTDVLNKMTGGDEVIGGAIDISPETLQHLSGVATGAAGTFFIDRLGGLVEKTISGEEIDANDLPLVRKVVGTKPSWYDKAAYYERIGQIENVNADIKEYRERGEDDLADQYEEANIDLVDMTKPMKAAKKQLRALKKERGEIELARDLGDMTEEDAKAEINLLRDEEKLIIEDFNAEYIATVAKPKRP